MGDDLSYGLNTLGPLCLWQCLQNSRSGISYFRIAVFLVIRIVFHFTPRMPTILLWPSASATCIYDIDYELPGIAALYWHHQSYWVGVIISQSHISKVSIRSCTNIDREVGSGKNTNIKTNINLWHRGVICPPVCPLMDYSSTAAARPDLDWLDIKLLFPCTLVR